MVPDLIEDAIQPVEPAEAWLCVKNFASATLSVLRQS